MWYKSVLTSLSWIKYSKNQDINACEFYLHLRILSILDSPRLSYIQYNFW